MYNPVLLKTKFSSTSSFNDSNSHNLVKIVPTNKIFSSWNPCLIFRFCTKLVQAKHCRNNAIVCNSYFLPRKIYKRDNT